MFQPYLFAYSAVMDFARSYIAPVRVSVVIIRNLFFFPSPVALSIFPFFPFIASSPFCEGGCVEWLVNFSFAS